MKPGTDTIEPLEGIYDHSIFHNEESTWTVGVLEVRGRRKPVTIVGNFTAQAGETLDLRGKWILDPKYGEQFSVTECQAKLPSTIEGLRRYLGSGMIKGIGPKYADRLIDRFGIDVPHIIEKQPFRLREVEGIGAGRQKRIISGWNAQKEIKNLMLFLQSHAVSAALGLKIYKAYGSNAIERIRENPYRLASDLSGVGFKTADQIARKIGIALDAPERIDSALQYLLKEAAESNGHTALGRPHLTQVTSELLEVDATKIEVRIDAQLGLEGSLVTRPGNEDPLIFLKRYFDAEQAVAKKLVALSAHQGEKGRKIDWEKFFEWFHGKRKIQFSDEQKAAIQLGYEQKVAVITGGPGTGKSTLIQALTLLCDTVGLTVALAAPTGRAAKRLAELTGKEAKTIHRTLEFDPKLRRFKKSAQSPMEVDLLIIDETSMVDVMLCQKLLEALREGTSLLLVGDYDQLPPVGPGNVLKDLINSEVVPIVRLKRIYRQNDQSRITEVAHALRDGEIAPLFENREAGDCFFLEKDDAEACANLVVDLVCQRLPTKYGYDARRDIQVLVPMNRGVVGTQNLNQLLQRRLNPNQESIEKGHKRFSVGDRVIQTRNNYDLEVFNGDIGFVRSVDREETGLVVKFDEREVALDSVDLEDLELAYAISIHKSQGSEFPVVVLPVHTQHAILLQRNLIYTGITRGKRMVVIAGSRKAVGLAIHRTEGTARTTYLQESLRAISSSARAGDPAIAPPSTRPDKAASADVPLPQ